MGGQEETKPELSDKEIIDKLKRILKCLEAEEGQVCQKDDEGDEWFKARKEKLRVPTDLRQEEMKLLIAEKMKQAEQDESKKSPETVLDTIYPMNTADAEKDTDVKQEKSERECKKTQEGLPSGPSKMDAPSTIEFAYLDMGLLQGPNSNPFSLDMTMGEISVGCQCIKRNGLQGDCKRKLCRDKKKCLNLPLPVCIPSGHGRVRPREAKIYMGEVSSCPKEDLIPLDKTVKTQKKLSSVSKDYIDNPPYKLTSSGSCKIHKRGRYYLRPLRRSKDTQTEELPPSAPKEEEMYLSCPPVKTIT